MKHLGLFAKFWQPGKVKTRLAATVGGQQASQIYYVFLSHLIEQLKHSGDQRIIGYYPQEKVAHFTELAGNDWSLLLQSEGDLGTRMRIFFEQSLDNAAQSGSAGKVVLIGSDCPALGSQQIEEAFAKLDRQPVVLGSSSDGGYYLIGMREKCFSIFDHIAWSTDSVLQQTIDHLNRQQIGFEMLPEMTDIDQWEDLEILLESLQSSQRTSDAKLLKRLNDVLSRK